MSLLDLKPKSEILLLYFTGFLLFTSCNVTKYYTQRIEKQYSRLGTQTWNVETDTSTIFWRKVGDGDKNLLLIHGFGPLPELQWRDVVRELHHDFTIYIPDLIYFGKSKSNVEVYDPRFITQQLHRSLENELNGKLYIAGISYGGLISSIYAQAYPEKVSGLILIDALSKYLEEDHTDSLAKAQGYERIQDILIPEDGKALKSLFKISFYKPKKYPRWLLNRPAQQLYANQKAGKRGLLDYLNEHEEKLKQMQLSFHGKVHIIWGEEDLLIPVSNAYLLERSYPNSNLSILPEVGHVANMESPEEVAKIIRDFCYE